MIYIYIYVLILYIIYNSTMFRLSCFRSFFSDEIETGEKYLSQLKTWVDGGKIQVPPVRTFPFSQLRDAHNALTSGQSVGKMVVTF